MSTGGACKTMPVAGAVTALRLIFLGVVMRRSLATGGSTTELSATDAWAHADGGVAEGRADRQDYKAKG